MWRATVTAVVLPVFQVACFQRHSDQVEQPTILDISGEQSHQYGMVNVVKASPNVALNEPRRAFERSFQSGESGMTSAFWSETVRAISKAWLVVGFQQLAECFLHQFV